MQIKLLLGLVIANHKNKMAALSFRFSLGIADLRAYAAFKQAGGFAHCERGSILDQLRHISGRLTSRRSFAQTCIANKHRRSGISR